MIDSVGSCFSEREGAIVSVSLVDSTETPHTISILTVPGTRYKQELHIPARAIWTEFVDVTLTLRWMNYYKYDIGTLGTFLC
jgi:hypothetical protein